MPGNRLKNARSPYLQQHADNPVEWWEWGPEAFDAARAADKPIFLSVGYSTCHWCHVMAHESFEDPQVAKALNEAFICIKVDREERPDVDVTYMAVCQAITGGGGWPLTVMMTPDLEPFLVTTYLPKTKRSKFGSPGMLELVPRIATLWRTDRKEIIGQVKEISEQVVSTQQERNEGAAGEITVGVLARASEMMDHVFDDQYAGFGGAPKFPTPHLLCMLHRAHARHVGSPRSLEMSERTLEAMRYGGIYDHLGHGYHRYATDSEWALPHFEKMLYDQAGIAIALVEAFQITRNERYAEWALETFEYVHQVLESPDGAYYAAEDADSEGVEGKFYRWTYEQLTEALGTDALVFASVYNVDPDPAAEPSVLRLTRPVPEEVRDLIKDCRESLLHARSLRVRPHRDENVLLDWNAFYCVALARAARALSMPTLSGRACRCLDFVSTRMRNQANGHLYHHFKDGVAAVDGNLDDYAYLVWALCELYMVTFDRSLLTRARELSDIMEEQFLDSANGGYLFTAASEASVLPRPKETSDGAMPSGNSAALSGLGLLAVLADDDVVASRARSLAKAFGHNAARGSNAYAQFINAALDYVVGPTWKVSVAARDCCEAREASVKLGAYFMPNAPVCASVNPGRERPVEFEVCSPTECRPPVRTPEEAAAMVIGSGLSR
eukprot:m51a1_g11875 hypothetical protein (669) ;mRNA; f:562626-564844